MQIPQHDGAEAIEGEREPGKRNRDVFDDGLMRFASPINRKRRCAAPEKTSREQPAAQNRTP
ncbi:hypothetical protein [Armatimonas sp.]|uniref:hypothetical protein n=1 Tax=Armatimonas sp. TaxID=1872638 RepID=UPI00374D2F00